MYVLDSAFEELDPLFLVQVSGAVPVIQAEEVGGQVLKAGQQGHISPTETLPNQPPPDTLLEELDTESDTVLVVFYGKTNE